MKSTIQAIGMVVYLGLVVACGGPDADTTDVEFSLPDLWIDGKADFPFKLEPIQFPEEREDKFTNRYEYHGYWFWSADCLGGLTISTTRPEEEDNLQDGVAKTVLHMYGPLNGKDAPKDPEPLYTATSQKGQMAELSLPLVDRGVYLVVVGTVDGFGKGGYRLEVKEQAGTCGYPSDMDEGRCDQDVYNNLKDCVQETEGGVVEAFGVCTDYDITMKEIRTHCKTRYPKPWCKYDPGDTSGDYRNRDIFEQQMLPVCIHEAASAFNLGDKLSLESEAMPADLTAIIEQVNQKGYVEPGSPIETLTIEARMYSYQLETEIPDALYEATQAIMADVEQFPHENYPPDTSYRQVAKPAFPGVAERLLGDLWIDEAWEPISAWGGNGELHLAKLYFSENRDYSNREASGLVLLFPQTNRVAIVYRYGESTW